MKLFLEKIFIAFSFSSELLCGSFFLFSNKKSLLELKKEYQESKLNF